MRVAVALLAAASLGLAAAGCGESGAEPGAPDSGATLVLDFRVNAVHAGVLTAKRDGLLADEGVELEITEPSSTADGAKLLAAGRADYAILDINDFGIARRRGREISALAAIVQRPLAAVIAADRRAVRAPEDLAGARVGVTGVPSDEAVLDAVLGAGGLEPDAVDRQTVGFQAAALLAAGRLDAATAFWNAEGVELRREGVPTREFRVDAFGAPRYPELVLAAPSDRPPEPGSELCGVLRGVEAGYELAGADPALALDAIAAEAPGSDPASQRAQLGALRDADAFSRRDGEAPTAALDRDAVLAWLAWAERRALLPARPRSGRDPVVTGVRADALERCAAGRPASGS